LSHNENEKGTDGMKEQSDMAETGISLIQKERERQVLVEGWSYEHDDEHANNELAQAAAAYALGGNVITNIQGDREINIWPSSWDSPENAIKRKPRLRQLVIAGALVAAEIDRLLRNVT
jgi:hypothetical protein